MPDESLRRLPYNAPTEAYAREVDALRAALKAHHQVVFLRLKWEHPRFRGVSVAEVSADPTGITTPGRSSPGNTGSRTGPR